MADDLLHGLAGEVGTEHIDLVGHSAVDEIIPQVDAVFLAEGLVHAVHKAQILPCLLYTSGGFLLRPAGRYAGCTERHHACFLPRLPCGSNRAAQGYLSLIHI